MKFILSIFSLLFACGVFAGEWALPSFAKRTALDVDAFRFPGNSIAELPLDLERIAKALGIKMNGADGFALVAETNGNSVPIPFTVDPATSECKTMTLRFTMPQRYERLMLYFDGKTKTQLPKIAAKDNLLDGALNPEKIKEWRTPDRNVRMEQTKNGLLWRMTDTKNIKSSSLFYSERIFPLPAGLEPGQPVFLAFDAVSPSASLWPMHLEVDQLDARNKRIGEAVFDKRWTMILTVPGKPFRFRLEGKLDPRAKSIRVGIGSSRNNMPKRYDADGGKLKNAASGIPQLEISRLEIRTGRRVSFPGANPALYTQGDEPGTSALRLAGHTAPLYNNFPSNIWSESSLPDSQDSYFWPLSEGTLEFRIKPEWDGRTVVLADNARSRGKSFLKLSYDPAGKKLQLELNDYAGKSFAKSIPCDLTSGVWHHLAVTWSSDAGVELFSDGKSLFRNSGFKPEVIAVKEPSVASKLAEYTGFGADCRRFHNDLGNAVKKNFLKGALDSVRVSKKVRYTENFTPSKRLPVDSDTCAAFDFERNFDGVSGIGPRRISGSIYAADVPPRADVFTVEYPDGKAKLHRYAPAQIPDDNMPQNLLCQTSYPVLPDSADFRTARVSRNITKRMKPGETAKISVPQGTVMTFVEIACPPNVEKLTAPFLRGKGEVDPRSYGDIARTLDLSDCRNEHQRARKAFDFLIRSTDYFTFQGAEFRKGENAAYSAENASLLAINSYACFECGPLNAIASGIFINSLGYPAVLTFGNGHLFQQVQLENKLRVFDLSAQQYFPSRDMDDAASLDEIEKDIYLMGRTRKPVDSAGHFYRMGRRGLQSTMPLPPERLAYTLYPGERFRYSPANNGESNDLNVPGWQDKATVLCGETWTDVQKETGADNRIGRVVQRPLPHTATGLFLYSGAVKAANGAFLHVNSQSFCYRIDSPYTIISGNYRSGDPKAEFELSWNNGATWRKLESANGICRVDLPLRGRHAALLRVTTKNREEFQAETVVQMNPRRLTGELKPGENELTFTSDSGDADLSFSYRVPGREIVLDGGFYFGAIPGCERQLFAMNPGETRVVSVSGISPDAAVHSGGAVKAELKNGKLHLSVPKNAKRQFDQLTIIDGENRKYADVLICPNLREIPVRELKGTKRLAPDAERPQETACGNGSFTFPELPDGDYVLFSLTRRDNNVPSYVLLTVKMSDGKEWIGARIRNPGVDYYKAQYGTRYSRFRWDFANGRDTYPARSTVPAMLKLGGPGNNRVVYTSSSGECAGFLILPADDREFLYQTIRNLTSMNRADYLFNTQR